MGEQVWHRGTEIPFTALCGEDGPPNCGYTDKFVDVTCRACLAALHQRAIAALQSPDLDPPAVAPGQVWSDGTDRYRVVGPYEGHDGVWRIQPFHGVAQSGVRFVGREMTIAESILVRNWTLVSEPNEVTRARVRGGPSVDLTAPAVAPGQVRKDESGVEWTVFNRAEQTSDWWICLRMGEASEFIARGRWRESTLLSWPLVGSSVVLCFEVMPAKFQASQQRNDARDEYALRGKSGIYSAAADAVWLRERGEDAASLRALVEAVDAAVEKQCADGRIVDSRAKFVNRLAALLTSTETELEELREKQDPMRDPGDEAKEDVPLGGLSHEDAHYVLSGIKVAADELDRACDEGRGAWPDDARRAAALLRGLLK